MQSTIGRSESGGIAATWRKVEFQSGNLLIFVFSWKISDIDSGPGSYNAVLMLV